MDQFIPFERKACVPVPSPRTEVLSSLLTAVLEALLLTCPQSSCRCLSLAQSLFWHLGELQVGSWHWSCSVAVLC